LSYVDREEKVLLKIKKGDAGNTENKPILRLSVAGNISMLTGKTFGAFIWDV
jgi:hypothetical protein